LYLDGMKSKEELKVILLPWPSIAVLVDILEISSYIKFSYFAVSPYTLVLERLFLKSWRMEMYVLVLICSKYLQFTFWHC